MDDRKRHASAIDAIDKTLAQIARLLDVPVSRLSSSKPASPGRKTRRRRRFAVSGDQSVLDLVKKKNGATTREINVNWKSEGRGGSADNTLTRLVKLKQLKRTPLKDQRGSRYTAA